MRNRLPALHDADNRSLGFIVSIRGDSLMGLLILLLRLFSLNLVYFDAILGVREVEVHNERVAGVNVFAFRVLA